MKQTFRLGDKVRVKRTGEVGEIYSKSLVENGWNCRFSLTYGYKEIIVKEDELLNLSEQARNQIRDFYGRFTTNSAYLSIKKPIYQKDVDKTVKFIDTSSSQLNLNVNRRLESLEAQVRNLKQNYKEIDKLKSRIIALEKKIETKTPDILSCTPGNCPYAENDQRGWGMSPSGWAECKRIHEKYHKQ